MIIHRITGEASEDELIAPDWCSPRKKQEVLKSIEEAIKRKELSKKLEIKI